MQSTRKKILEYLQDNHQATVTELSQLLGMTTANIRHHLSVLEEEQSIEPVGQVEAEGRGRPMRVYMLKRPISNHGLVNFGNALVASIDAFRSRLQKEKLLKTLAAQLAGKQQVKPQSISIQLGAAVRRLNELGYRSHWEAHSHAPIILLGQCPYQEVEDDNAYLCKMDQYLIETLCQQKLEFDSKFSRKPGESKYCVFKLLS